MQKVRFFRLDAGKPESRIEDQDKELSKRHHPVLLSEKDQRTIVINVRTRKLR